MIIHGKDFANVVENNANLVISTKKGEGAVVVWIPKVKMFCMSHVYRDKLEFNKGNLRQMERLIMRLVKKEGDESNLQFRYPCTWPSSQKGRLFYLLDNFSDEGLREMLCLLI